MTYYTILKWLCQHLFQLLSVVFLHQLNILNITHIWAVVKSLLEIRLAWALSLANIVNRVSKVEGAEKDIREGTESTQKNTL